MHIKSKNKKRARYSPLHILLGAAVLASIVMPLAFAGASSPTATSAKVTDAKFKGLKKRVAALEGRTSTPTGPAGGDLQGQYPNPQLKANSVTSNEIADDAVGQQEIGPQAIGFNELGADSVGSLALAADGVGSSELKGVIARVSPAGVNSNNTFVENSVTCAAGEMVIGGGYAWTADTAVDMVASAPDDPQTGNPNTTWVVRGRSTGSNNLFAWANCLQV
jgi:hypothetical protein